jgi:hypothetical protein
MVGQIKNIFKTAVSFLQTGVAPPNTSVSQQKELENTNHLSSKKFFITFSGFLILGIFYASSVAVLFALNKNPELSTVFSVMFSKTIEVFATIMAVYIGGQAVVDLKYNSTSNTSASVQQTVQTIDITQKTVGNVKEDDYMLHD